MVEDYDDDSAPVQKVLVRQANILVWGPIFVTLALSSSQPSKVEPVAASTEEPQDEALVPAGSTECKGTSTPIKQAVVEEQKPAAETAGHKKITYIYHIVDHGLDCECIDIKSELLIRSALPTYRKISQGIEFEQVTNNQVKLIITSRVIENYQEVFQGFSQPKATFRIWLFGYRFFSGQ